MEVGKQVLDIAITILLKLYAPIQTSKPLILTFLEIPSIKRNEPNTKVSFPLATPPTNVALIMFNTSPLISLVGARPMRKNLTRNGTSMSYLASRLGKTHL